MPLTTPVYVIKLFHLLKLLHLAELPLTAPVYVRRLLHLAFLLRSLFTGVLPFSGATHGVCLIIYVT